MYSIIMILLDLVQGENVQFVLGWLAMHICDPIYLQGHVFHYLLIFLAG